MHHRKLTQVMVGYLKQMMLTNGLLLMQESRYKYRVLFSKDVLTAI
jgi:hypothetical protein